MRVKQTDVIRLHTAKLTIELAEHQSFWRTVKTWEIWQDAPELRLIKRISRNAVLWIETK